MFSQFSKMYIGATRIAHAKQGGQAVWDEVTGPAPVAPFWTTQPAISPASGPIGTVFTLAEGAAGGSTPLTFTARLMRGATDVTDQITVGSGGVLTYTSTVAGTLSWSESVSGPGGGPVQSAVAQATVTAAIATTTLTLPDNISVVVEGSASVFYHPDGGACIVSASPVRLLSKTPAATGAGAAFRHGDWVDPTYYADAQPYDGRRSNFTSALAASYPLTLNPGQGVLLTRSSDLTTQDGNPASRCGYTDAAGYIYVATTAPTAGVLTPASVGWPGRSGLASPPAVDYAAKAAQLPVGFGGGTYPSLAQVQRRLRFNPFYAQRVETDGPDGYESFFPTNWAADGEGTGVNWNYGRYLGARINDLLLALIAPVASVPLTVKAEILMRIDSFANQCRQTWNGLALSVNPDGAHRVTHQVAFALADWMRGQQPSIAPHLGNWLQAFYVPAEDAAAALTGFGDPDQLSTDWATYPDRSWQMHNRRITGVAANVLTVATARNSLGTQGDAMRARWTGGIVVRLSDGKTAKIVGESTADIVNGLGSKDITIDAQPTPAFAATDVIWMHPPNALVAGTPDWKERANRRNSAIYLSSTLYRDLQSWAGLLVLRAMGLITAETVCAWDYYVLAAAANTPAGDDYPGAVGGDNGPVIHAAWLTALIAVPQPYLPVVSPFYPAVAAVDLAAAGQSLRMPEGNNQANAAVYTDYKAALVQTRANIAQLPASTTPWATFAIVGLSKDKRYVNATPGIVGTGGSGGNRWYLRFGMDAAGTASEAGKFKGYNFGASGAAVTLLSQAWTEEAALVVMQCDGASNWQLDWYSLADGTRFAGPPATVVAGANSLNSPNPFQVGGNGQLTTWAANGGAPEWPGEIDAIGIVTAAITPAQWQAVALGADILTTLGAANLKWIREFDGTNASLAKPAGATADLSDVTAVVTGTPPAIPNSVLKPGGTLRRQTTNNWLMMNPISAGWVYGIVPGTTKKLVPFSGKSGGYSGSAVEVRVFEAATGRIVRNWTPVATIAIDGTWSGTLELPKAEGWWFAQARVASQIADRRDEFALGHKILLSGQSQMVRAYGSAVPGVVLNNPMGASFLINDVQLQMGRIGMNFNWSGLIGFVNQFKVIDPLTPIMVMPDAMVGTSMADLINDSTGPRKWSDLQAALNAYGNDFSAVVLNWGTNDSGLTDTAMKNLLSALFFGTGPSASDHNFTSAFQTGCAFALSPLTRYTAPDAVLYSGVYANHRDTRQSQVQWANINAVKVGPPVSDMRVENIGGPHQDLTVLTGSPLMMSRLAIAAARAMGLDTSKNPYFTTVSRSGATLTVGVSLQNGGTLTSPTPGALRSFQVDEGSTGTWSSAGFTAAISGNSVVLTRSTGTWAANTKVRYLQGLEDRASGDSATEDLIINSALYETWAADVIGRGLPVLGSNTGSAWEPNWEATAA